jgi:uncharacterized membrane protein YhaH (DUF805 family)
VETVDWYLGVWRKYAVFSGRARRKEYWMFFLFNLIATFLLSFADVMLGFADESGNGLLGGIYALAVLIPSIAVGVRRMHDTNHSGWWLIVPIVSLVLALMEGTRGPNRFGPDPKERIGYAAPSRVPAGWQPDPYGRHQYRYWDSTQWTRHVSDNGVAAEDPA